MVAKVTNLCRLCTEPCLSETFNHSIKDSEVRSKLEIVFNFELANEESLPEVVCPGCFAKVTDWYSYQETVRSNQHHLMSIATEEELHSELTIGSIKVEIDNEDYLAEDVPDAEADIKEEGEDQSGSSGSSEQTVRKILNSVEESHSKPQDSESLEDEDDDRLGADGNQSASRGSSEEPVRKNPKRATTTAKQMNTNRLPLEKSKPEDEGRIKQTEDENSKIQEFFTLTCEFCSDTFKTFSRLQFHMRRVHSARASFKCCNLVLYRKYQIIDHIDSHVNPDRYHCDVCKRSYKNRRNLKDHIKLVHREKDLSVPCDICQKLYPHERALYFHKRLMHSEKKFDCEFCGKKFKWKVSLKKHACTRRCMRRRNQELHTRKEHNQRRRVKCDICNEWFSSLSLKKHIQAVHSVEDLSVQCDICQKMYLNERALYLHKRLMHSEKKFECEFCGKKYGSKISLMEHRRSHTGQPLYSCNVCGRTFKYYSNLSTHKMRKHSDSNMLEADESTKPKVEKRIMLTEEEHRKIQEFFPLTCEFCSDTFDTFYRLQDHTQRDHNARASFKCCNLVLLRKYEIIDHIDLHMNPDHFHCDVCKINFKCKRYLKHHIKIVHSEKDLSVRCDICQKMYSHQRTLNHHKRTVHTEKTFDCELCGKKYKCKANMKKHICTGSYKGDLCVRCDICQKMYSHQRTLNYHKRTVHTEETFDCELCGKKYKCKANMKKHICTGSYKSRRNQKEHNDNEKPFKCDECPQSFSNENLLKAHLPAHIQAECPVCHEMIANAFTLRRHMAKVHKTDETKLTCETCGEQFRTELGMERHIKRHQGVNPFGRVQCDICNKWLSGEPRSLKNHMKIVHSAEDQSVRCDICQKKYPHERALYYHKRRVHNEEKLECEFCGKKFKSKITLKEHRASHSGQPLYSCNVCEMTTNARATLYAHKKSKHPEEWLEAKNARLLKI